MSEAMPGSRNNPTESPQKVFLGALNKELDAMQDSGKITAEIAADKLKSAEMITEGFSTDPAHDAAIFAMSGIGNEEEMIELFNKNKPS